MMQHKNPSTGKLSQLNPEVFSQNFQK